MGKREDDDDDDKADKAGVAKDAPKNDGATPLYIACQVWTLGAPRGVA